MFSFHKPRVYRSTEGCCICRAKSSSSRFTDSKKYEDDSVKCFNLEKPRQGEICNACVLLVKRFKRLPVGSNRHWGHVVDARIGPGMKSISKFKKLKEECQQQQRQSSTQTISSKLSSVSEKFCKIFRKNKKKRLEEKFNKKRDDNSSDENSSHDTPESLNSDEEGVYHSRRRRLSGIRRRKGKNPKKLSKRNLENVRFFDESDWVPRWLCCGVVYENSRIGALLIDHEKFKPCSEHIESFKSVVLKPPMQSTNETLNKTELQISKTYAYPSKLAAIQNVTNRLATNGKVPVDGIESLVSSATTIINKNHLALKKHHIYYKRQSEIFPQNEGPLSVENSLQNNGGGGMISKVVASSQSYQNDHEINVTSIPKMKHPALQKPKPEPIKLAKHVLDKISNSSKVRLSEPMETNIPGVVSSTTQVVNTKPTETSAANKFSDNSSDSGFDENLPDHSLVHMSHDGRERKIVIRPIESLFLSSTVPITLPAPPGSQKPTIQSHKTIHTPHSIALLNNRKIRAIYNATSDGGLACVALPTASTSETTGPSSTSITHKKFLYVKGKQNIEATNN